MRQHLGLSKGDLVEEPHGSATGSDQMAHKPVITSLRVDENIVASGFHRYIIQVNFAVWAAPGGVGMLAR
jgi:hypothetical protein